MKKVTATEFARNFSRYRETAQREPIAVTSHGRPTVYVVSAQGYGQLTGSKRRALWVKDLPRSVIEAIAKARVPSKREQRAALRGED
jgi:prevent-host-death family protein